MSDLKPVPKRKENKPVTKETGTVVADYYKGACMKLLTVAVVEAVVIFLLFGLWIYETMQCVK